MEEEDDIILGDLDDEELVQQMFDDLYDGLKEEIEEAVHILLERKWEPYRILTEALVGGMTIVGQDFRDGILFVPEVLLAANAMKGGMTILKPLLAETGAPRVGKNGDWNGERRYPRYWQEFSFNDDGGCWI
jgi:5-methyltetrahydrofolate--homocysteine methyltransferase